MYFNQVRAVLQFRNCKIILDNLSDQECLQLGLQHNKDNAFHLGSTFLNNCMLYRNSWFDEYKELVEKKEKTVTDWQKAMLRIDDEDTTSADVRNHSPTFNTARWDQASWDLLNEVDALCQEYKLKGQKKPRRVKKGDEDKVHAVGAGYITALNGLTIDRRINFLTSLVNGSMTLKECKDQALQEKRHQRVLKGMCIIAGRENEEDIWAMFPKHTVQRTLREFSKHFGKDRAGDKLPISFQNHMNKIIADQQKQANAAVELQGAAAGFEEYNFHRILMAENEFRGFKERQSEKDLFSRDELLLQSYAAQGPAVQEAEGSATTLSKTSIKSIQNDVMEDGFWTYLKSVQPASWKDYMDYKLVMMDPPYGLTKETWDVNTFTKEQYATTIHRLCENQRSSYFTTITFCSAYQVSHYLDVLRGLSGSQTYPWVVHFKHGVWSKGRDHFTNATAVLPQEVDENHGVWFLHKETNCWCCQPNHQLRFLHELPTRREEKQSVGVSECEVQEDG